MEANAFDDALHSQAGASPACAVMADAGRKGGKTAGITACVNQRKVVEGAAVLQDACVQAVVRPGCLKHTINSCQEVNP